jgi:hypothetical protein
METPFTDFLNELATDEDLFERFVEDPWGVGAEFGLTHSQVNLILQGDKSNIEQEIAREHGGTTTLKYVARGLIR